MPADLEHRSTPAFTRPGLHSHNIDRKTGLGRRPLRRVSRNEAKTVAHPPVRGRSKLQMLFLLLGLAGVGYYVFTLADRYLYQAYENWAFDQEIAGRSASVRDWMMQSTPLGRWTGYAPPAIVRSLPAAVTPNAERPAAPPLVAEGDVLGRIEIPRLNLSAIVRQGVDASTLSRAVGHVPSTQGPGVPGNFAIAAHRDTLFRALKDIKIGDDVRFESPERQFDYRVISTRIVKPSDVSVLRPQGSQTLMTMITCYPFYYVGSAPKRFIVTARLASR